MGGGEKVKKLGIILLPRKNFGYCSVLLSWDIVPLYAILQAFPVIVSYTEFPLKSIACSSTAGYGCKGGEFYPNVTSQMTAVIIKPGDDTTGAEFALKKNKKNMKI